jgi:type II secretory pathway component PulF
MIVVVGLILGVMVLGMFLPIFTLGEAVMSGGQTGM